MAHFKNLDHHLVRGSGNNSRGIGSAVLILVTVTQMGCAAYTVASMGSSVATGSSPSEHAINAATGRDCSVYKTVVDADSHSYVCEQPRDAGTHSVKDPYGEL
jgi:hypothetical protein